jgi:integrase
MRWSEIDDEAAIWRIPGERMKNSRPHVVHLSEATRDVLRRMPHFENSNLVLTTTGATSVSGFSRAKAALD